MATARRWRTARLTVGAAVLGLAVAISTVLAAGPWEGGRRTAERARAADRDAPAGDHTTGPDQEPSAAPVLAALGGAGDAVPAPTRAGLADALEPLLKDDRLGSLRSASVLDVASGQQVFGSKAGRLALPASTIKLATAVAALSAVGPHHRIATTVTADPAELATTRQPDRARTSGGAGKEPAGGRADGEPGGPGTAADTPRIVLVGGGDPTLTGHPVTGPEHPASLRRLAEASAHELSRHGVRRVRLGYDTSAYSGPDTHPIGPNENIAPVRALMADEGRLDDSDSGPADRAADPSAAAASTFADLLADHGVTVVGEPRAISKRGGGTSDSAHDQPTTLATVHSPPLSALVERMLTNSDNDIGEALARQTAIAAGQPASFEGGQRAVTAELTRLGVPTDGVRLADGSGLDRDDRVSAGLLSHVLLRAADPRHSELRSVLTGLPVAGFTGTLRERYAKGAVGRGVVRAKTGTLTGVNTLAGTVVDADGRLLVFAFMTNHSTNPAGAQRALDRLASAVANCGCR